MDARTYHIRLDRSSGLPEVVAGLEGQGLRPVFKAVRDDLVQKLECLGFSAPRGMVGSDEIELLVVEHGSGAVALRLDPANRLLLPILGRDLDLLLSSQDPESVETRIQAAGYELLPHSLAEARSADRLRSDLGELSPNGKRLADANYRAAARSLYDDELRASVAAVSAAFRSLSVPETALVQIDVFSEGAAKLSKLLAAEGALSRNFSIQCKDCGQKFSDFPLEASAESSLVQSTGKCPNCGAARLEVVPTFALTVTFASAIQQGLWLESLASDVAEENTDLVWTGQMVGSKEIDVLAVLADKTVLIECKDTSFGQTELAMTALKAAQIQPDLIIVISTRDVHHNVRQDIDKLGRDLRVISEPTAPGIRSQLSEMLEGLKQEQFTNWLAAVRPSGLLGDLSLPTSGLLI